MFKNNILNAFVNQSFPNKCQTLNSILEECNPKELCSSFEIIVNCLFSSSAKINYIYNNLPDTNYSSDIEKKINWPLKLVNRSQYCLEYDCIFNFLNSNSLFWYTIFKLDHTGATFSIECNSLPTNLKYRVENGLSLLSVKADAFNVLNLSALEFYMVHFLLLLYDNKTNSRRLYNEQYGNIELDSVYADLLNDYLNYFLPINERDVNFPKFVDSSQRKPDILSSSPLPSHKHHTSLLRRVVQKSLTEDSLSMLNEPDTVGDMKKINLFLRLFIDILINSFTDTNEKSSGSPKKQYSSSANDSWTVSNSHLDNSILGLNETTNKSFLSSASSLRKNSSFPSPSPVKLNDPKQYLANIEIIFALSMALKHFHIFSTAFPMNLQLQNQEWNQLNESLSFSNYRKPVKNICTQSKSPIDELRTMLFKMYLRKPFYKFFQFHLEHWPLTPSIKWIIECWLTYIQPWKFIKINNQIKTFNLTSDFIKENILIYTDIYQYILKRYCIFDLTNEDNLIVLHRILSLFYGQAQLLNKHDNMLSEIQSQLIQMTKQECDVALRQNNDFRLFVNLFNEFEKPIYSYKPLNSIENLKLISNFYDALINAKNTLGIHLKQLQKPQNNFISNMLSSIFHSDQNKQFGNLSIEDHQRIINLIDECDSIIKGFYKSHSYFEVFGSKEGTANISLENSKNTEYERKPSNIRISPECELTSNGSIKLSPRGRFQIINKLCNPVITNFYDPDTSPIGEFENKFLVFCLQKLSNHINERYCESFDRIYNRDDLFGRIGRKFLYGPNDIQSRHTDVSSDNQEKHIYLRNERLNQELNNPNLFRVRLSLRALANYRFILYFCFFFFIVKLISGFSYLFSLLLVSFCFLIHFLMNSN